MASNRRFQKNTGPSAHRSRTDKPRSSERGEGRLDSKGRESGNSKRFQKDPGPSAFRSRTDKPRSFEHGERKFDSKRKESEGYRRPPRNNERSVDARGSKKDFWKSDKNKRAAGGGKNSFNKGFRRRDEGEPGKEFRPNAFRHKTAEGPGNNVKRPAGNPRYDRQEDKRGDRKRPKPFAGNFPSKDHRSSGQRPFYKTGFGNRRKPDGEGMTGPGAREERKEKSFVESRVENSRQSMKHRRHEVKEEAKDGLIRLNKFISNSGVCSRREADNLISMGLITVNGKAITELGYKVKVTDDVRYEGRRLKAEPMVYILMNKPKGVITTTDDPQERNTVMNLIQGACKERVYPVGRLDRNTSGLLLLTNDGELTDKLTHPSYNAKKIYKVEIDKPLTKADFQKVRDGVRLEEGVAVVDDLAIISEDGKTIGIEIHIGWNRVIRRIFEVLGYEVVKLDRTVYATLDKKDLPRGHWRFLRQDEVIKLKHFL